MKKYLHAINHKHGSHVSSLELWKWMLIKETQIYSTLNKMRRNDKFFLGLFWTPINKIEAIKEKVEEMKRTHVNVQAP